MRHDEMGADQVICAFLVTVRIEGRVGTADSGHRSRLRTVMNAASGEILEAQESRSLRFALCSPMAQEAQHSKTGD